MPVKILHDFLFDDGNQIDNAKQEKSMKGSVNQLNRFVVACEFRSGSRSAFDAGLREAGSPLQVSENLWLLRAIGTAGSIRNFLFQRLGARDTLMVLQLDAVRTATQNFGPEMDARIRAMLYLEVTGSQPTTPEKVYPDNSR